MKRSEAIKLLNDWLEGIVDKASWQREENPDATEGELLLLFIEEALRMEPYWQDFDRTIHRDWEKE